MSHLVLSSITLNGLLGSGHFGEVFAAQHPILGAVAVKKLVRLPGETDNDWTLRWKGLVGEGQRLKAAEHDKVVRVFDVAYSGTDDAVFLVMELCDEGALSKGFEAGPLTLHRLRDVLTDVALGLQAVHIRGMLHRDIKPANILIKNGQAKLGDFGLVTDNLIVGYASARGYTDHQAPEVLRTGRTSQKTDVWALGMTAYRLLHGKTFYDALPPPRTVVLAGGFAKQLPWLPHIAKRWRSFIRKLMADDPADRYQNVDQILTALASLPITPDWSCSHSPPLSKWERTAGARRIEVTWEVISERKHTWVARSLPVGGSGRPRTLASSSGVVKRSEAVRGLEAFLLTAAK